MNIYIYIFVQGCLLLPLSLGVLLSQRIFNVYIASIDMEINIDISIHLLHVNK